MPLFLIVEAGRITQRRTRRLNPASRRRPYEDYTMGDGF